MSFPRYAEYVHTNVEWLRRLPSHWSLSPLKRLVDPLRKITYGIVQAGPHVLDGVPYIRPADMSEEQGVTNPEEHQRTSAEIAAGYSRSTIQVGDIVISIGPSFGKVMLVPTWLDGANLTQGTARVSTRRNVDVRYVFWVLRSIRSFAQWESSVGGATFRALNLGPLSETVIPIPPVHEQQRISRFLDRETAKIDALVAEQQRLMELLKEKRQAVISHAVTKGLNPDAPMKASGVEWLGEVPAHWEVRPLKWSSRCASGKALSNEHLESLPDQVSAVPVIGGNGLMGYSAESNIEQPVLAIGRVGALCGNVHVVNPPAWITDNALVLTLNSVKHRIEYLAESLLTRRLNDIASKTAQPLITGSQLSDQRVPTPPLNEQEDISAFIRQQGEKIDQLSNAAYHAVELLEERRTALISAAVTGQIDVRGVVDAEAA